MTVYLRDLKKEQREDWVRQFEKAGRKDLLKAIEEGDDVEIGEYFNSVKECKVV